MKKIILSTIIYFIFITSANAQTNFIQYTKDNSNLELQFKYKWYQEEIKGVYLPIDEESDNWQYVDNSKISYSEYSDWIDDCEVEDNTLDKEMKKIYSYKEIVPARYIVIESFSTNFIINNLNIYNNAEEINFEILECKNCDIKNKQLYTNSNLIIDLKEYYKSWNLSFDIDFESKANINQYKIYLYNDIDNKLGSGAGNKTIYDSIKTKKYKVDSSWMNKITYTDILYSEESISPNYYNLVMGNKLMCRYRKIYNYRYNIIRKYYDNNYHNFIEDYKKDNEDYIIYYKYKNKDNITWENKTNDNIEVINNEDNEVRYINNASIKENTKIKYIRKNNTKIYIAFIWSLIINLLLLLILIIKFCRLKLL